MKKTILLLVAVMALGLASCDRKPHVNASDADMVIVDNGKLAFYDMEAKKLSYYEKETDSVINLLFDENNHLYYTVSKPQGLSLMMLDMSQTSPEPKVCADWGMTLEESVEEMSGDASCIYWDKGRENIFINKTDFEDYTFSIVLYNPTTGKVRTLSDEEIRDLYGFKYDFDPSHFYSDNNKFYYVTQEGKTCLNDKIDYNKFFQESDEVDVLEFDPETMSPDGKRLIYDAEVYWGEGWGCYCVANLDGTAQDLLLDSNIWDLVPQWLSDGSFVYVGKAGANFKKYFEHID